MILIVMMRKRTNIAVFDVFFSNIINDNDDVAYDRLMLMTMMTNKKNDDDDDDDNDTFGGDYCKNEDKNE